MWQRYQLQHNRKVQQSLAANLRGEISPFDLSVSGIKIGVHNWSHGITEKTNKYLSPENAARVFQQKLQDNADPNRPKGAQEVVGIMVASADIDGFIATLEQVAILLPEPTFKQAYDYAKSSKTLADTRMVKTPPIVSPAFAKPGDITPQSSREMQSVMRNVIAGAGSASGGDPAAVITQLQAVKARRKAENQQKVAKILSANATVFGFKRRGSLDELALMMGKNVPDARHVFTAAVCFIGQNLTNLAEMLHD